MCDQRFGVREQGSSRVWRAKRTGTAFWGGETSFRQFYAPDGNLRGRIKSFILNLFWMVGGHQADIRQVAVALGIVQAVADNEEVGDGEANVVGLDLLQTAGGLVEQRGDTQGFGVLLQKELAQVREGETGVENVLDHEHVLAFDGRIEVFDELDRAGGTLPLAVAGDRKSTR